MPKPALSPCMARRRGARGRVARAYPPDAADASAVEGKYFGERSAKRQQRATRPIGMAP